MQQRQTNTSRASESPEISQPRLVFSPGKQVEGTPILPLHKRHSGGSRRGIWDPRLQEKLVHLIPVIVLLCFFILWWFSYPVHVEIKNGRVTAVDRVMLQNVPFSDLDDQASTFPTYPPISEVQMAANDSIKNEQEHKEKL